MLQIGDEIKAGDEYLQSGQWKRSKKAIGETVNPYDMERGWVWRRPERRTYILVMAPDTNQDDQFESGLSVEVDKDGHMILDAGPDTIYVPVTYAQSLVDAIKEVAGLE